MFSIFDEIFCEILDFQSFLCILVALCVIKKKEAIVNFKYLS